MSLPEFRPDGVVGCISVVFAILVLTGFMYIV